MDDYKLIISPIINGLKDKNLNNYNSTAPDAGHSGGLDGTKLQTKMRLFQQDPSACPREMLQPNLAKASTLEQSECSLPTLS